MLRASRPKATLRSWRISGQGWCPSWLAAYFGPLQGCVLEMGEQVGADHR